MSRLDGPLIAPPPITTAGHHPTTASSTVSAAASVVNKVYYNTGPLSPPGRVPSVAIHLLAATHTPLRFSRRFPFALHRTVPFSCVSFFIFIFIFVSFLFFIFSFYFFFISPRLPLHELPFRRLSALLLINTYLRELHSDIRANNSGLVASRRFGGQRCRDGDHLLRQTQR